MRIESFHQTDDGLCCVAELRMDESIDFDFDFQVRVRSAEGELRSIHSRQRGMDIAWLPRGRYRLEVVPGISLQAGDYRIDLLVWSRANGKPRLLDEVSVDIRLEQPLVAGNATPAWNLQSVGDTPEVTELSWNKQHSDWFFRHFDHAARVIIHMMLDDSPRLRGKILDVGCGDGIIDLAVFLRCRPELLVGIDPFAGFERLPEIVAANHLPPEVLHDPALRFAAEDGNAIPWPDNHFDVVLSWGSLEHIAGGYAQTFREIRRVLKPGGLLFVHPGLYYGQAGNHLGEFFDDPYIHLKVPPEELRRRVLTTEPRLMDRAGDVATPEQYWQWYTELNPITVEGFEKELRALNFEPWRVALRSADLVEYTPELQKYSFTDLATTELYLSAINRKPGN